jgi:dienelactone hydrolase
MYRLLSALLFVWLSSFAVQGQNREKSWDDSVSISWPSEFRIAEIRSSADGSKQRARFYSSRTKKGAPLIVSLHTWSGDYNQEDPLAGEIIKRGWNYIHPDFRGPGNRPEAGGSDLVISDIGDAINYALRNSDANPDDVHIIGVSGGGYATLAAYMKLRYPVRSFNSWAAISDLEAWYDECRSRNLKYSVDLEKITTGGTSFDATEAQRRSPLRMNYPVKYRAGSFLNIYAGINDGYNGSVPITHSIEFFNTIAKIKYPGEKSLVVPDSIIIRLLGRRVDPQGDYQRRLAGRNVYLSSAAPDLSLTIFEGGHEMLVPEALSLIPVGDNRSAGVVANPDTNVILPPAWAFGLLYGGYTDQEGTVERIKAIQEHDYPIDAYWIDSWFWSYADSGAGPGGYLNFVGDTVAYPDRRAMWSWMEQNNIKGGFWIWDCIQETGNETVFRDFLDRGFFSGVYLNKNPWHNKGSTTAMFSDDQDHPGTLCGNIDFDNPLAVRYFKNKLKPFFEEGADFIKLDRTDKISVCRSMHELTLTEGKESMGRGLILSHSGGTGSEEYKRYPLKWTDDTRSDWSVTSPLVRFDPWVPSVALKENIAMYTDPSSSASSIPFLTNDLGGFDMGKVDQPEVELYIRWMQFSMFCPVTEVFCQPENPTSNLAWKYSPLADTLYRNYSHRRMKLFPYLYSYAHLSRLRGVNMVRSIPGELYMYMLGNELLVAPVYERGRRESLLHLPRGNWINYWTGEVYEGEMEHLVAAPLEQIPLFVRQGSVIPERCYAHSVEGGTNDTLTLHVYPGADGSFTLIEDDGRSNDYLNGSYATTMITLEDEGNGFVMTIEGSEGSYRGMNDHRYWLLKIHSGKQHHAIKVNGKSLRHHFDSEQSVTSADLGRHSKDKKVVIRVTI